MEFHSPILSILWLSIFVTTIPFNLKWTNRILFCLQTHPPLLSTSETKLCLTSTMEFHLHAVFPLWENHQRNKFMRINFISISFHNRFANGNPFISHESNLSQLIFFLWKNLSQLKFSAFMSLTKTRRKTQSKHEKFVYEYLMLALYLLGSSVFRTTP